MSNLQQLPIVSTKTFRGFAIVDATVTHEDALNGNSGTSTLRVLVGAGNIWLGEEDKDLDSATEFFIQASGESEHTVLAEALRWIADELEKAPKA